MSALGEESCFICSKAIAPTLRYVLLHHVIGGLDGKTGTWGYVFGGMGAVSKAIANAAQSHGANIFTEKVLYALLYS